MCKPPSSGHTGVACGSYFAADSVNWMTIASVNGLNFDPDADYALVRGSFLINSAPTTP